MAHHFHIPVLGLGYSIDTPLKVARYGISSVVSIVDDELAERMRAFYSKADAFIPIAKQTVNSRAERIKAYLNLLHQLVNAQFEQLQALPFMPGNDLCKYFDLLPENSQLKQGYDLMLDFEEGESKTIFQNILRKAMQKGAIDVNIMAKVDKKNYLENAYTGDENTDAMAALRGFAESDLHSSVVLSAGMNPYLYSYLAHFDAFYPNEVGLLQKKITLKVSDFRSAFIQAKFLAKKGLWVSEFRIESGLNCGGHAFATEGYLMGPILEEFKQKRVTMLQELHALYLIGLQQKGLIRTAIPPQKLSVQGGIGTSAENAFLLNYYQVDSTGWGSPFLLVPEVTNVDEETLNNLVKAKETDYYLSNSSPLGVLFNNFTYSSINQQRVQRMAKGKPGSPCTKKYLCTNTEFTAQPICTASRQYQLKKIHQLKALKLPKVQLEQQLEAVTEKVCLCEGLCASVYLKNELLRPKESAAVAICPGPNLAYFSKIYSLEEMVKHIYGKLDLLEKIKRPNLFIKELNLNIDYLQKEIENHVQNFNTQKQKKLSNFKAQLQQGIAYYQTLFGNMSHQALAFKAKCLHELLDLEQRLNNTVI